MIARFLAWRIARHDARAKAFGSATVAAQAAGDRANAARFQEQMHHAQYLRDGLQARACPPCNHDCNEGRTCPART